MTRKTALLNSLLLLASSLTALANASEPHPEETAAIQHVQAADVAMKQKEFAKAVTELEQAVSLAPDFAEYHFKLSNAHVAAKNLRQGWLSLRRAAKLNPGNEQISNMFSRFWNMFDQQGVFNVGQPVESVVKLLGKPDQRVKVADRDRLVYGFYSVDTKKGSVYELLDLRGLKTQHLVPKNMITVDLDGRNWRVDYRVNNQLVSTAELVLPEEKIQNWSELVNIQRLHGQATTGRSLEQVVEGMMASLKKSNPDRQYRIIEKNDSSILFEWKTSGNKNSAAQHELVRLFYGSRDMHRLAYVKKCTELPTDDRQRWVEILKAAELKSMESVFGKALSTPKKPLASAATRADVWKLGGRLSGAAIMHSQGASPKKTQATFEQARSVAEKLGITLDPLPELVGDNIKDSLNASTYLMAESGRRIHRQLTANYDRSHAALLETAIKSNMLIMMYVPNDSTGKALGQALEDRIQDAKLPEMLLQPLLRNIENGAERKLIVMNVLKLHTDVKLLLEKQAETAGSPSSNSTKDKVSAATNQLQGIWKLVKAEGAELSELPTAGEAVLVVEKNRVSFVEKNQETTHATFEIDAIASPMRIVWLYDAEEGGDEERVTEIFKFEDDMIVFCGGSVERVPTEFSAPNGSDRVLTVYKKLRG